MTSASANGHRADTPVEFSTEVAELASEISEAKTASRRKRLASQLPALANRSRQASLRGLSGLQAGRQTARKRLQAGGEAARRSSSVARRGSSVAMRGGAAARRGVQAGGDAARRGGSVARRGVQVGGSAAWRTVRASGQWLAGQVVEMAPKIPVRSIATLRAQYPGRSTEELADSLITGAARASAGIGAAVGAAAAVPFIPTAPVELAVETLALVAIEIKLIAELHEVYGMRAPGTSSDRMIAYVGAWANRRGVRITSTGVALAVGSPLRRKLERRLIAKAGQSTLALAPLFAGAVVGAMVDHRETRRLGNLVRTDLHKRSSEPDAISG